MKNYMGMLGVGLVLMVAGCATNSGYVGTWECNKVPPKIMDDNVEAMTVYLTEQGAFSLAADDASGTTVQGMNGSWTTNGVGGVDLSIEGESEKVTGQLLEDDILLIAADGDAVKFTRKK